MAHVEARTTALAAQVVTVLRIVWIARAGKDARGVVNRLAIGVSAEQREAESQPLLQSRLEAVIVGSRASFLLRDLAEERIGVQVRLLRARLRLIDVSSGQQFRALRSDVGQLGHEVVAELSLNAQIPVLRVRRAEVAVECEGR